MADLNKVRSGSPLRMSAKTFNAFIDAARNYQEGQQRIARDVHRERRDPDTVLVRNTSGTDQDRFAVMSLSGIVITPTDNLQEFENRPAFDVVVPTAALAETFVILQEPVAAGAFGQALIGGVTPVMLDVVDEAHASAFAADSISGHLVSGAGLARILWKETGTGLKWAVVQFPVGGSGGSAELKLARITGKAGTTAPYLYTGLEVEHDGSASFDPGNFTEVTGGDDLGWKLINAQEIGDAGIGVSPLPLDSIVVYTPMGSRYLCTTSNYRGTY